jgi:hypothetical protein
MGGVISCAGEAIAVAAAAEVSAVVLVMCRSVGQQVVTGCCSSHCFVRLLAVLLRFRALRVCGLILKPSAPATCAATGWPIVCFLALLMIPSAIVATSICCFSYCILCCQSFLHHVLLCSLLHLVCLSDDCSLESVPGTERSHTGLGAGTIRN